MLKLLIEVWMSLLKKKKKNRLRFEGHEKKLKAGLSQKIMKISSE